MGGAVPAIVASGVLALVRLLLVVTFTSEAKFKFSNIRAFAKNDGVPLPAACVVAFAEAAAALSMLTGVLVQWAGIGIVLLMVMTIGLHLIKWHSPYWANKRGWEYDVLMLALAAVIVVYGPGLFALHI